MAHEYFDEFRKIEMKMITLDQVRDNLYIVADGFHSRDEDPECINAILLNVGVMRNTLDDLRRIFARIEGNSPADWGLDEEEDYQED